MQGKRCKRAEKRGAGGLFVEPAHASVHGKRCERARKEGRARRTLCRCPSTHASMTKHFPRFDSEAPGPALRFPAVSLLNRMGTHTCKKAKEGRGWGEVGVCEVVHK